MKVQQNVRYAVGALAVMAAAGLVSQANAQTETVPIAVTVQNTLTLTQVDDMDFGTLVAVGAAGNTASVALSTAGALGVPTTSGGGAYIAVVDTTNVTAAALTVEDGAAGANINVDIPIAGIVEPTFGGSTLDLGTWRYSWNGGASAAITPGTPVVVVFDAAFAAGVNTIDVGATLSTQAGVTYGDGAYVGSFDIDFSY